MELNLSLGGDHRYAASKRKTTSNFGSGGLMESPVGFRGGRSSSGEEVSGSRAEDGDRLLLLLPLLGGRRKREAKVVEQSNEADGMVVTARKKLKLSKEQSSFLEQSFEEHQTLGSVSRDQSYHLVVYAIIHDDSSCTCNFFFTANLHQVNQLRENKGKE